MENEIITGISVVGLIVNVILIIKFFQLVNSVEKIKNRICTPSETSDDMIISSRLNGNTDQMRQAIINKTVICLERYANATSGELNDLNRYIIDQTITTSQYSMRLLGEELPKELQSLESYQAYRASISPSVEK